MRNQYLVLILHLSGPILAQFYRNSTITRIGDQESIIYNTSGTISDATVEPNPDVFFNGNVAIGTMDLNVDELTAKISLDAKILSLFDFGAGVKAHTEEVKMKIKDIASFAHLETRLGNLVNMVNDVLNSIDLNPSAAKVNRGTQKTETQTRTPGTPIDKRAQSVITNTGLSNNILYTIKDYEGRTHTNRILTQTGDIIDEFLDRKGIVISQKRIENYEVDMTPLEHETPIALNVNSNVESRFDYNPIPGIHVVIAVFKDASGKITKTEVLV
jgi:hypothetical protein